MEEIEKLKEEIERLKMINENKSDLVSIGAHQIRTSLTAFKWTLKMFVNDELGNMTDEQKGYLNKIISNNEYTISLVNDLLKLNHSRETQVNFNFKPVNLLETTEKIINLFQGESKSKNINIILEKPQTELPKVNWTLILNI